MSRGASLDFNSLAIFSQRSKLRANPLGPVTSLRNISNCGFSKLDICVRDCWSGGKPYVNSYMTRPIWLLAALNSAKQNAVMGAGFCEALDRRIAQEQFPPAPAALIGWTATHEQL